MKNVNPNPGFPLHRLNTAQTKVWMTFPNMRGHMANNLAKLYGSSGVGLLSATLRLFVLVFPTGKFQELPPPFKQYEMWQVSNSPHHYTECACREYFDPEVGGKWKERGENYGHHPFCQFRDTAKDGYDLAKRSAEHRVEQGLAPQARPDEWLNTIQIVKGS